MKAPVAESMLELIGSTPIIKLKNETIPSAATIWAKCEHLNPGGSVKDRICLAMIEKAEKDGILKPGATVVEPTSGNTGIGLALVCAVKGYHLVLTMPASMSLERRQLLQAYGVEIILTEPERVMDGAIEAANQIVEERGAFMPQQFTNTENPNTHQQNTAREIMEALEGKEIAAFVAGVGTGGTIHGVSATLKQHFPNMKSYAVEPESSPVISGGRPGPSKIQGLNAGFIPQNYNKDLVDEIILVSDKDAYETKQTLAKTEGLLVGISAGANVFASIKVTQKLGSDAHVVTILCDTGERYFSLDTYFNSQTATTISNTPRA